MLTLIAFFSRFIDNRTVFKASKVKHSHAPVRTTAHEHIHAIRTESYVEDLFVMGNQLGFGCQ